MPRPRHACLCAAVVCGALALLLAGVLLLLAPLVLQMRTDLASDGFSNQCVLGTCLYVAPGTVTLSWSP